MRNLTPNQYSAIDRYKELGQILTKEIPQLADDYRSNLSLREIVEKYYITELYNINNQEIARSAVSYALKLLLPEEELERLVKIHNQNNGIITLKNRGIIFWTDEEKDLLYEMSLQPKYQKGRKLNRKLIANEINTLKHNGNNVRDDKSITAMIWRIRKKSN